VVRTALAFLIAACVLPRTAHAGRSFYGWLYGTEVLPERGVELETWVQEENDKYETHTKESWVAWGPVIGITDQLELELPVELEWLSTLVGEMPVPRTLFTFRRFGVEARYRLVSPDPVDAPALVPLIRIAVKRDVTQRDDLRIEGDAVVSYDAGAVQALIDLGATGDISSDSQHVELHPGAGVSVRVTDELRIGAEFYSELSTHTLSESWATAGPNLSWSHGRFWLSGAFGIGFYHVRVAPRVIWGIAF
jgi:hypothetical protein